MRAPKDYEPPRFTDVTAGAATYRWLEVIGRYKTIIIPVAMILIIVIGTVLLFHVPAINFEGPITH